MYMENIVTCYVVGSETHFACEAYMDAYMVQLKGNLTPTRRLLVVKMRVTMQNSQLTGAGACKGNLKHLSDYFNQQSVSI